MRLIVISKASVPDAFGLVLLINYFITEKLIAQQQIYTILEGTARYAGLLLAPAEGFGLRPRALWPSAKAYMAFGQ